jgi:hypothetical protein
MESIKRKTDKLGEESKWNTRNSSVKRFDTLVKAIKESIEECSPSKRRETRMKNWNHGKTNGLKCIWWNEDVRGL